MVSDRQSTLVRRLGSKDASLFISLRRAALEGAPFAFGSSPEDDRAASIDFVRDTLASPDQAIFGAFAGACTSRPMLNALRRESSERAKLALTMTPSRQRWRICLSLTGRAISAS